MPVTEELRRKGSVTRGTCWRPWGWPDDLGIWHELNGVEIQFVDAYNPIAGGLQNGVPYRLRFRVTQDTPTTSGTVLAAKRSACARAPARGGSNITVS